MHDFFEIAKSANPSGFDVIRLIVAPILSLITAAMAISVFSATYFIVFRIKKYLKRHKTYLNFSNKLQTSVNGKTLLVFRSYETTMWGTKSEENKEIISSVLTKYKSADLKDLILGTYNDELKSIKSLINHDQKLIKNNQNFLKFQRLFHINKNGSILLQYFNVDYMSFYKVKKSGVIIGIFHKDELKARGITVKHNIDYSELFSNELESIATIYRVYFIKRTFVFKSVSNPNTNFEETLLNMRKIYNKTFHKKYLHQNIYLKDNFLNFPNLDILIKTKKYIIQDDFLLESSVQKQINIDKIISEKLKKRKEIKEIIKKS